MRDGLHREIVALPDDIDDIQLVQSTAWTVVGEEGSYHTIHNHIVKGRGGMGGISTVLYLNIPESVHKNKSNSIFLVLHADPSSHYINHPCPSLFNIEPEVGTLLIFPPHIPHGTYPQTKGIRQTFNIDYNFSMKSKSSLNYV